MKINRLSILLFPLFLAHGNNYAASFRNQDCLYENICTDVSTLNPQNLEDLSNVRVIDDLFEGLVSYNQQSEIMPGCAEKWKISEDGKVYTFYLRKNAQWSNGDPLTSHDFVYTYRLAVNPQNTIKYYANLFNNIEMAAEVRAGKADIEELGVNALDLYTLEIKLKKANPEFLKILGLEIFYPIHKRTFEKYGIEYCTKQDNTVCNGAYTLKEWIKNGHIKLVKNMYYWAKDKVAINNVKYLMLQDTSSDIQAFDSQTTDITYKKLPIKGSTFYKEKYGNVYKEIPSLTQDLLIFNFNNEKFEEVNVRKALTMVIDMELFVKKILKYGTPSCNPILETLDKRFVDAYKTLPEYSWIQDKVDKRIIEANLLMEDYYNEYKPLNITITYPVGDFYKNIAEFLQFTWNKAFEGIVKVSVLAKLDNVLLDDLHKGDFDISHYQCSGYLNSPEIFTNLFISNNANNFGKYKNPQVDKLYKAILTMTNTEDVINNYVEISKLLMQDFAAIPLFSLPTTRLVSSRVGGFNCENNILNRYYTKDLYLINK